MVGSQKFKGRVGFNKVMSQKTCSIKKLILITAFLSCFTQNSFAAKPNRNTTENKIRNPTLSENTWVMPQVSVIMPSDLQLKSPNFEVAYGKQFPSLTQAGLIALTPLFNWGAFRVLSSARLGFSYKAGPFELTKSNGETLREYLKLSWVPMSLGTKFIYTVPNFPFIKPSLTLSGGAHWFYQTGAIKGANQSFWVPYFAITPALSFLEGSMPTDWFGGFTFGLTYQHSLSELHRVNSVSFDMGINILL